MRLLLKHLLRCVRRRPLQPVILVLTLALAITTAAFAFTLEDTLNSEASAKQAAKYGSADITVGLSASSESRFIFAKDAEELLGDNVRVSGAYELPMVANGDTILGVAVDMHTVNRIFKTAFTAYGTLTDSSLPDAAFISEALAKERALKIGDTLSVRVMGDEKVYTVAAISPERFIGGYDVMVDISGVVRIFANKSLLFSALGEDFKPCSTLYIDVIDENADGADAIASTINALVLDARFADKYVTNVKNIEIVSGALESLDIIIALSVALAALLCAAVSFCCFYILAKERTEESAALAYSGAGPGKLALMQYSETLLYWLIATPIGILLAIPAASALSLFIGLEYATAALSAGTAAKSALVILAISLLTSVAVLELSKHTRKQGTRAKSGVGATVISAIACVICLAALIIAPPAASVVLYVLSTAATVALIFIGMPTVLRAASALASKLIKAERGGARVAVKYAFKNISSLKLMHNIARLSALITVIIVVESMLFISIGGFIGLLPRVTNAEYAVINATDQCYEKVSECGGADRVYRFYMSRNSSLTFLAADDLSAYSDYLGVRETPVGNKAIISKGIADQLDISEGDTFTSSLSGEEVTLEVMYVSDSPIAYVAFDNAAFDIPYNMLLVSGKPETESSALLSEITERSASELATVVSTSTLLQPLESSTRIYLNAGIILLSVFVAFSLIGMVDTVLESLRSRREEFELYRLAGFCRKNIRLMKLTEVGATITIGALVGILLSLGSILAADRIVSSFSYEMLLNLRLIFK